MKNENKNENETASGHEEKSHHRKVYHDLINQLAIAKGMEVAVERILKSSLLDEEVIAESPLMQGKSEEIKTVFHKLERSSLAIDKIEQILKNWHQTLV